jgi:hypothetical protein
VGGGVQLGPLGTAATNRPIVPAPDDYDDGEIGGMLGRGNWNTQRKPAPVPLCPPQTPHAAQTRTQAAAVGSQRLTAWATARLCEHSCWCTCISCAHTEHYSSFASVEKSVNRVLEILACIIAFTFIFSFFLTIYGAYSESNLQWAVNKTGYEKEKCCYIKKMHIYLSYMSA